MIMKCDKGVITLTSFVGNPSIGEFILEFTASSFIDKNYSIAYVTNRVKIRN